MENKKDEQLTKFYHKLKSDLESNFNFIIGTRNKQFDFIELRFDNNTRFYKIIVPSRADEVDRLITEMKRRFSIFDRFSTNIYVLVYIDKDYLEIEREEIKLT